MVLISSLLSKRVAAFIALTLLSLLLISVAVADDAPDNGDDAAQPTPTYTATVTGTPTELPLPTATVATLIPTATATPTEITPNEPTPTEQSVTAEPEPEETEVVQPTIEPTEPQPEETPIVIPETPVDEPGEMLPEEQNYHAIIVELNTAYVPESFMQHDRAAIQNQRARIDSLQNQITHTLEIAPEAEVNITREYETLPLSALVVNDEGLEMLLDHPAVAAIYPNERHRINMGQVNQIIGTSGAGGTWAQGLDGSGYAVAILDTGVDFTHPALQGKAVAEACFSSAPLWEFGDVPACPNGQTTQIGAGAARPYQPWCYGCDHGTMVAGIAAGNHPAANYYGVAPGASIIGINVFTTVYDPDWCGGAANNPCTASYSSDQIAAMEYIYNQLHLDPAFTMPIASVNMSLGSGNNLTVCGGNGAYDNIVSQLTGANIAVIAASGNNGRTNSLNAPACRPNVISVGATTKNGSIASFSNNASFLDLYAPGMAVTSPNLSGGYSMPSGTSMAAPVVAGAWAIMRQADPTMSVSDILTRLKSTGVNIPDSRTGGLYTHPRIQLQNALTPPMPQLLSPGSAAINGTTIFTWEETAITDGYSLRVVSHEIGEIFNEAGLEICTDGVCEVDIGISLTIGTYTWELGSINAFGTSINTGTIHVAAPYQTHVATNKPTFRFPAAPGASWHYLYVWQVGGAVLHEGWYQTANHCSNDICAIPVSLPLETPNSVNWGYISHADGVNSPWSPIFNYDFPATTSNIVTETLNVVDGRPSIEVARPSQDGFTPSQYQIWILNGAGQAIHTTAVTPESCNETTCIVRPSKQLDKGSYSYWIRGHIEEVGGYTAWTGPTNFTTDPPAPAATFQGIYNSESVGANECADGVCTTLRPSFRATFDDGFTWAEIRIRHTNGVNVFTQWININDLAGCEVNDAQRTCTIREPVQLANATTYNVDARGYGPGGIGAYTSVQSLNIAQPVVAGQGINNQNAIDGRPSFVLDRPEQNGARPSQYQLWINNAVNGANVHSAWIEATDCNETTCTIKPAVQLYKGSYTYWVQGYYSEYNTYTVWSGPTNFTTDPPAPAATFQGIYNSESVGANECVGGVCTTLRPSFRATFDDGFTWAEIRIRHTNGVNVFTQWININDLAGCEVNDAQRTCTIREPVQLANATTYNVDVRGYGPGGIGAYTSVQSLNIAQPVVAGQGINNQNAIDGRPSFVLDRPEQNGARPSQYQLWINNAVNGANVHSAWIEATDCNETTCTIKPAVQLDKGSYTYWVQGYYSEYNTYTVWSGPTNFTTDPPAPVATFQGIYNSESVGANECVSGVCTTLRPSFRATFDDGFTWAEIRIRHTNGVNVFTQWININDLAGCEVNDAQRTCTIREPVQLANATTYNVDVRGYGPGGIGAYTSVQSLNIAQPVVAGQGINNQNAIDGRPSFIFNRPDQNGAKPSWYQIWINNAVNGANVHSAWIEATDCNETTCTIKPAVQLDKGSYTYWVQGYYSEYNTYTVWSGPTNFTTDPPPPTVTLESILNNQSAGATPCTDGTCTTLRPSFRATFDDGFTWAEIRIRHTNGVNVFTQWININDLAGCEVNDAQRTCTIREPVQLANATTYNVDVRGYGPGGIGAYTSVQSLNINAPVEAVTGLGYYVQPDGRVALNWDHKPGSTWYRVYVMNNMTSAVVHDQWYSSAQIGCAGTCSLTPQLSGMQLTNGNYGFYVQHYNGIYGAWSDPKFDFILALPAPQAILSAHMQQTVTGARAQFHWQTVEDGFWYLLEVQRNNATIYSQWHFIDTICTGLNCAYVPQNIDIVPGDYRWRVRAYGPNGQGNWSAYRDFTVASAITGAPALTHPANGATLTNHTPAFTWNAADNADWYEVYVNLSSTGQMILHQWFFCPHMTCTFEPNITLANGNYRWWVRAYGTGGYGEWSSTDGSPFTIAVPPAPAPILISPANNATISGAIPLTWERSEYAAWYMVEFRNNAGTPVYAQWYMANAVGCQTSGPCSLTLPAHTIGSGVFTWTVSAWSQSGVINTSATRTLKRP